MRFVISTPNKDDRPLDRPVRSEGADGVSGKGLCPSWPTDFEDTEGMLQRQNQSDETELPEFDTDVEANQC